MSTSGPSHGVAIFSAPNKTVTYTPDSGFSGTDTIAYTVTNSTGSSSATLTIAVAKKSQTISFDNPGNQTFGTNPTLSASTTSELPATFTSTTPGICTVTGNTLTFGSIGTCTIEASQAGDDAHEAAATVAQSFAVEAAVAGAPVIGTVTAGDGAASIAFTAPDFDGGSAITGYTVLSSPDGLTATGAGSPITVTGLTNGTAYTFTVTAHNEAGSSTASVPSNPVTPQSGQTISFDNPGNQTFGTNPMLSASTTSDLPVTFTSTTPGICTVTGNTLTFGSVGTCTIEASQPGDAAHEPAATVAQSFAVVAAVAGAPVMGTATASDGVASISFTAPDFDGGSPITGYAVTSSPDGLTATGAGSPITVTGLTNGTAYTFTVTAHNEAGSSTASTPSASVTPQSGQTISFDNPGNQTFGTTPTLSASATSELPVTFTSTTSGICTVTGNTLSFGSVGTCTIEADQPGDAAHEPAATVTQGFEVVAAVAGAPVIGTVSTGDGTASISFTAPDFDGGSPITGYAVTSSPDGLTATGAGSPIVLTGLTNGTAYTFTVTAHNEAGSSTASTPSASVTPQSGQTISFDNPGNQTFGTTPTLSASATSELPVTFTSTTSGICTVTGNTLTFGSVGTCTIEANQPGDAAHEPAATVTQSFAVEAAVAGAPVIGTVSTGDGTANISFTAPDFDGGSPITGYTVTSSPDGITATATSSPITVTGLTNGTAYTFTVTAHNEAGSSTASTSSNPVTPQGGQTISFGNPGNQTFGTNPTLSASATSELPVTFTSTTPGICTVTGNALSFVSVGTCTIEADQPGDDAHEAATTVVQSFAVEVPDVAFAFTPPSGYLPSAMAGEPYGIGISASKGVAPLLYGISEGNLPRGMVLNVSTGELSGPLSEDTDGEYKFTIKVRDAYGSTGEATYSLLVQERSVTVEDHEVSVPEGEEPPNVDLSRGATGGPFVEAIIVSVEPANAGTAEIVDTLYAQAGQATPLQFYLSFTPNPSFSGEARVGYQLISSLGSSNVGTVVYNLSYDRVAVADEIDTLVQGFVQARQNLIASTIKVPTLLERRRLQAATDPIVSSLSPSANGLMLNFATSLARIDAAQDAIDGVEPDASAFNIWIDGTLMVHNREQSANRWGSFGMVSAGADYLLTDRALIGLSLHHDRMIDPTDADATLAGTGWLAGPYGSFEIGDGVFWDTSLLYGGSGNTIDTAFWDGSFDTRRWLLDTAISGQWRLDEATTFTPTLRAVYLSETVQDYVVENGSGDVLVIEGFTAEQLRVSLGAEITRQFTLEDGSVLTPSLGLTGGFSGLDGSGAFGSVSAGVTYQSPDAWTIGGSALLNFDANGRTSFGARVGLAVRF